MITLKNLLSYLAEKFPITVRETLDGSRKIQYVDILSDSAIRIDDPDTLYLCRDESILQDPEVRQMAKNMPEPPLVLSPCTGADDLCVIQVDRMPDIQELFLCFFCFQL